MKTFLKTGVLLVSLGALASSPDPSFYQYWFDRDEPSRAGNTHIYDSDSNPLSIDVSGLSEGGHAVFYRMADKDGKWGTVMTKYFVVRSSSIQGDPKEDSEPVLMQYWFDDDEASRQRNTRAYDFESNSLEVDASGLLEGVHVLNFRMANKNKQWGSVMTRFFTVPSAPDQSTSKAVAYRVWVNHEVVTTGELTDDSDFTMTLGLTEVPGLNTVKSREFIYRTGEKTVSMSAEGKFFCAFQMLSENNEWGMPLYSEYDHSIITKLRVDSVPVPYDYTFGKPDINNFKAYTFHNSNNSALYIKPSQDCVMSLYSLDASSASNISLLKTMALNRGVTTKYEDSKINNRQLVAIIYDVKSNAANQDDDVFLRIMYENNKLPKPVINFDPHTWEVTMTCADQRAEIRYTLDGNIPNHESPKYDREHPIILDRMTKVRAIAVYGDLEDSEMSELTVDGEEMKVPRPELKYVGGIDMNEFTLTNSMDGVTTYYLIGSGDIYDEGQRKTFDGNPFIMEDGASLKAYSTKELLGDSEVLSMTVNHKDYVTQAPELSATKTEGEDGGDISAIKNYLRLSVPDGKAKYRIVAGKQEFGNVDDTIDSEWTEYDEGWIELPGGAFSGNQTVLTYAEANGKARSKMVSLYSDWVKALKPKTSYDDSRLKIYSDMPGGLIKYNLGNYDAAKALEYKSEDHPDGLDFGDANIITTWVEAVGYANSDRVIVNKNEYDLVSPVLKYQDDGYLHVTHDVVDVQLVIDVEPAQALNIDTVAPNHLRFKPEYNSTVRAYARKTGFNNSDPVIMVPVSKPIINVDAYAVEIQCPEGEVYYTTDGTTPTKLSAPYTAPFETAACTVRAAAFKDGMIPSEADPKKVMDQAAKPYIEDIIDGHVKLATETPNATIYYSLDQGISDGNRKVYDLDLIPDGIDITTARSLYAYAEAEGYRRSETFDFFKSANTLSAPTLAYSNGYVVAEHEDNSVEIIFTDEIGNVLMPDTEDPRRVGVPYNSTLDAYAYRKGFISSDKVRLNHTDIPEISVDLFTVSIKKKSYQTVRYTTDGSQPDASSTLYEDTPFTVSESCTIRAVAFEGNLIPSEAEPRPVGYRRSEMPEVKAYDGRYLTLKAEEGSTIRYIIGQSTTDVREGSEYNGKIDIGGLSEVKAIARRADAADSEVFSFIPEFYANDSEVFTSKPGIVKDAFGWTSDMSAFTSLSVHGPLVGASTEDSGDYAFLRSLPNLRHIDLRDVSDTYIPNGALDAGNLLSIVLPAQLTDVGTNIFGDSNVTLCSLELPMDGIVPANLLKGIGNSNLLLYVRSASNSATAVSNTDGVVKNVVVLGGSNGTNRAENVTLRHGLPFHAHKAFDAQKISFTRPFSKQTQIGGYGSGWETMAVPFNVQAIECTGRVLRPFGEADTERGECPFWLFSAADTDWKQETAIYANTPYLIAMPNHPYYADEFVVKGDVVFSSNVVTVPVTPDEQEMTSKFSAGRFIKGSYDWIRKEEGKLAVNESVYAYGIHGDFQPGGIFISGERDIPPFECYVESQGAKAIPVFDRSQVDDLLGDYGTHIWSENRAICVRSGIAMKLRIYDMVGQLIRIVDVKAGETVRVDGITPGIYFVGNTKILVKG